MTREFFEVKDGYALLRVKATTKASKNAIVGIRSGELFISVTAVPENGKANEAIVKLLSKSLKCAKTNIELVSGSKSKNKLFRVDQVLDLSKLLNELKCC